MKMKEEWKVYIPTVDIPILITSLVFSIIGTPNSNLNLQRICYLILDNNKADCQMLGNENNNITQKLEAESQRVHNKINLVNQCSEAAFTMFISLLIGPWTDRFGRKPGLILASTGMMLTSLYSTFNAAVEISPWYSLLGGLPGMFTGGGFSFMTVANSYLMDITNMENRGFRVAVFGVIMSVGGILGTFVSTPLLYATSYLQVNIMGSVLVGIVWLYTIFGIKESLPNPEKEGIIRGFFDLSNPKRMFITTFKRREGANRGIILLITAFQACGAFIFGGSGSLRILYLRKHFGWVMRKYTIFDGASSGINILGTIIGTYVLTKIIKPRESFVLLGNHLMMMVSMLVMALATKDWHIYLTPLLTCFEGTSRPFMMTLMSKLVLQNEMGKVLSGISGASFFVGLAASPTYTEIYNETLDTYPQTFNFVSAMLLGLSALLVIAIIMLEKKYYLPPEEVAKSEKVLQKTSIRTAESELVADTIFNTRPRYSLVD